MKNIYLTEHFNTQLKCSSFYNLSEEYKYDFVNRSIVNMKKRKKREVFLSKREDIFLKLLLQKNAVVTYDEMETYLSVLNKEFTNNARRSFIKNLRKKLPPKILMNIFDLGYKLDI